MEALFHQENYMLIIKIHRIDTCGEILVSLMKVQSTKTVWII